MLYHQGVLLSPLFELNMHGSRRYLVLQRRWLLRGRELLDDNGQSRLLPPAPALLVDLYFSKLQGQRPQPGRKLDLHGQQHRAMRRVDVQSGLGLEHVLLGQGALLAGLFQRRAELPRKHDARHDGHPPVRRTHVHANGQRDMLRGNHCVHVRELGVDVSVVNPCLLQPEFRRRHCCRDNHDVRLGFNV